LPEECDHPSGIGRLLHQSKGLHNDRDNHILAVKLKYDTLVYALIEHFSVFFDHKDAVITSKRKKETIGACGGGIFAPERETLIELVALI